MMTLLYIALCVGIVAIGIVMALLVLVWLIIYELWKDNQ